MGEFDEYKNLKFEENEFDEYQDLDLGPEESPETSFGSKLKSGGLGGVQGATFDFADELYGGARAAWDLLTTGEEITPEELDAMPEKYRGYRDEVRKTFKDAQELNPKSYMGGQLGGGLATMAVPGIGAVKGIKGAAALGGLYGLGSSNSDLTKGELGGTALSVAGGAAGGALMGGAVKGLAGLAKGAAPIVKRFSKSAQKYYKKVYDDLPFDKRKLEVMLRAGKKSAEGIDDAVTEIGKLADDYNINLFKTTNEQYNAANTMKGEIGKGLSSALGQADEMVNGSAINPKKLAKTVNEMREALLDEGMGENIAGINRYFDNQIKELGVNTEGFKKMLSFTDTNKLITDVSGKINNWLKPSQSGKKLMALRSALKEQLDDGLKSIDMYKTVQPIKRKYELATGIADATKFKKLQDVKPAIQKGAEGLSLGTQTMQVTQGLGGLKFLGIAKGLQVLQRKASKIGAKKDMFLMGVHKRLSRALPKMSPEKQKMIDEVAGRGIRGLIAVDYILQQKDPKYQYGINNER